LAAGQTSVKPPCEYGGELLRQSQHKIMLFTSDEVKAAVTYKQDIFGAVKQADIKRDGTRGRACWAKLSAQRV
jgi:hypothetical protein